MSNENQLPSKKRPLTAQPPQPPKYTFSGLVLPGYIQADATLDRADQAFLSVASSYIQADATGYRGSGLTVRHMHRTDATGSWIRPCGVGGEQVRITAAGLVAKTAGLSWLHFLSPSALPQKHATRRSCKDRRSSCTSWHSGCRCRSSPTPCSSRTK